MDDGASERDPLQQMVPGYAERPRPLSGYLTLIGLFNAIFAIVLWLRRERSGGLPSRMALADLLLAGVASHKISRLIAKDSVTSPLRAPFVEFQGAADLPSELKESPRGHGLRKAIGELIT